MQLPAYQSLGVGYLKLFSTIQNGPMQGHHRFTTKQPPSLPNPPRSPNQLTRSPLKLHCCNPLSSLCSTPQHTATAVTSYPPLLALVIVSSLKLQFSRGKKSKPTILSLSLIFIIIAIPVERSILSHQNPTVIECPMTN